MMDPVKIADTLRRLRGNISREEVATNCDISVSALAMYETGARVPRDDVKIKLAKFFGKSIEDIFFST